MVKKKRYSKPKIKKSSIRVKLYRKQTDVEDLLLSGTYLAALCEY